MRVTIKYECDKYEYGHSANNYVKRNKTTKTWCYISEHTYLRIAESVL